MFIPLTGAAPVPDRAPSSLLRLIAGDFAPHIAEVWPEPHAAFLDASGARRHLACLALSLGVDLRAVAGVILGARLRHAISAVVTTPPAGLHRTLSRMGEVAHEPDVYRLLLPLLQRPGPAKVLRHAEAVDGELVRRLAGLPQPMEAAVRLARDLTAEAIVVLREAYEALGIRDGRHVADAAASRWAQASSARSLFALVRDDLTPEPPAPPHPGTPRLRPLASKAEIRDAARRYRNCLADRTPHAAAGWSAFYEWDGPPGVVVEVSRDHVFGWRLDQARTVGNCPVPEAVRDLLAAELALIGVHIGRSGWQLDRLLREDLGRGYRYAALDEDVAEAFGED